MEGTTTTIGTLIESAGTVFTAAIGWVGDVATTIAGEPILLLACVGIPLCGLGVGMFIAAGLILVPFVTKKLQSGLAKVGMKDKKWGEIFNNAMFLGMISAFLGYVFCDVGLVAKGDTSGLIPVCVMATSAVVMAICGTIATKCKIRWLTDYALPMSLIAGMASAIPFTMLLGG